MAKWTCRVVAGDQGVGGVRGMTTGVASMTDPFTPADLREMAQECREDAKNNRMCANTAREFGGDPSTYDWPAQTMEKLADALEFAAAREEQRARLVEKWRARAQYLSQPAFTECADELAALTPEPTKEPR